MVALAGSTRASQLQGQQVQPEVSPIVVEDPDLSVRESSVSGDEGGSITVQCLYSAAYQNTQKKWCRFRDRSCNSVWRTDTSQNSAVNISDDGKSSFSVQMSGLKKSDGGWYWCSAGDLEVPVYISVRDPPPDVVISQSAYRQLSLQTGASVTIPCSYDRKYLHHKKYWCYHAVSAYNYCTIQAYANKTQGKVTVTDNPAESLFTVTMKNLQTGNTGGYWCVVEIEGPAYDVTEYLYITVKAAPDLSVRESRVSGDEGGSVTVQCLYSAVYQKTQKKWCRFRDRRCNSVRRTDTSQNSAIIISDDGKSSFSVQMSGLKKSDGGWYWCSAGDLEVPVHISVRDPPPGIITNTDLYFN
ncbi:polymeric immunoglobulin receptor-like [Silurus meridionalis]|nr:polymeric immunoglobulin receptor-like [Silurus meridionalis]